MAKAPLLGSGLLFQRCHCVGFLPRFAVSGDRVRNV